MKVTKEVPSFVRNEDIDIRNSDVPYIQTFQRSERHTDVTAYDLSVIWNIKLFQATRTIKKTTKKFLRITVFMLARR